MTTNVLTLREYGEMIIELADDWEDDQPAVLVGDVNGSVNCTEKDGFSNYGPVGYAHECFDGNGVWELGNGDLRFYGAMLMDQSDLAEDAQKALAERRNESEA